MIVMSCPSVCLHGKTQLPLDVFSRNLIGVFLKNLERVLIQVRLKSDKSLDTLHEDLCTFMINLNEFLL